MSIYSTATAGRLTFLTDHMDSHENAIFHQQIYLELHTIVCSSVFVSIHNILSTCTFAASLQTLLFLFTESGPCSLIPCFGNNPQPHFDHSCITFGYRSEKFICYCLYRNGSEALIRAAFISPSLNGTSADPVLY